MRLLKKVLSYTIAILLGIVLLFCAFFFKKDIPATELYKAYTNKQSKFVELMGMNVHYRDEGNANDSLPLVFIHGTSSSLHTWDEVTKQLQSQKRIIRFDLPGFGLTGPQPNADYSFTAYENFVDSLLQYLKISRCIIAGNSLGGGIAWRYALHHPEKVKKLIAVDASGFPAINAKGNIGFTIAQTPGLKHIIKYITPRFLVAKSLRQSYGNTEKVTDSLIERYYALTLRTGNRQALIDRMQFGFPNESTLIPQIQQPSLIIWGDLDRIIPVANAYQFKQAIRNSQLYIIKGSGHVPMEENPEFVAERIASFIQ